MAEDEPVASEDETDEENIFSENIFDIVETTEELDSVEFEELEIVEEVEESVDEELVLEDASVIEDESALAELLSLEPDYENMTDEEEESEEDVE